MINGIHNAIYICNLCVEQGGIVAEIGRRIIERVYSGKERLKLYVVFTNLTVTKENYFRLLILYLVSDCKCRIGYQL